MDRPIDYEVMIESFDDLRRVINAYDHKINKTP